MCTENGDIFTPLNRVNSIGHHLNPSQGMYHNPSVMKSLPSIYPSLSPAKLGGGPGAPSAPELPQPGLDELLVPGGQDRRDGEGSSSSNSSHSTSTTV